MSTTTTNGSSSSPVKVTGADLLRNNYLTKGTAFTPAERSHFRVRGMLPPFSETLEEQAQRSLMQLRAFEKPIEKYIYLTSLSDRNITVYYKLLMSHLEELCPIVYTPTVGQACQQFGALFRFSQGMYFSAQDRGHFREMLDNWPNPEVDIIVVTDGSRILGLGDLGASGMGIPIGKLALYVAAAGFQPQRTLPVLLDVGTNNEAFLKDPHYLGLRQQRLEGGEYDSLVDEFVKAVHSKWPRVLLQWEDFSNDHAFELLARYRDQLLSFNDDIQGTGAVILSGWIVASRLSGVPVPEQRMVFLGAGSAGVGVADCIVRVMTEHGLTEQEARRRFYFVDSQGLVHNHRAGRLEAHKVPYARDDVDAATAASLKTLLDVIKFVKPTGLIGLSGQPGSFNKEIIDELCKHSTRPLIFALSNPTSKSECTAAQAFSWSDGRCLFASGSPFDPVEVNGVLKVPGQGNNMYIFPGLGFGAVLCKSRRVSDDMLTVAAKTLADSVSAEELKNERLYPSLTRIRDISANIAANVIRQAIKEQLVAADYKLPVPDAELPAWVAQQMYTANYDALYPPTAKY